MSAAAAKDAGPPGAGGGPARGLPQILFALALGAAAGAVFYWLTLPLPWMLGAMIVNTLAAIGRLPVASPVRVRPYVVVVIGVMLGSGFTPEILDQLGLWTLSFLFLGLYIAISGAVVIPYYRWVGGFDLPTAYFAGMPGGLNEMMIVGKEMGGDDRAIALAHASRIVIVVALVAVWFRLIQGVDLSDRSQFGTPFAEIPGSELVILFLAGVAGYALGKYLRLPAPMLLGPMIVSAAVHLGGLTASPPPQELVIVAQVFLGTIIGCRFVGAAPGTILRAIGLSIGATVLMLAITFGFALLLFGMFNQTLEQVILAYSPGGLAEMSLVALAMDADIAYVASHHLLRISMIVLMAPLVFGAVKKRAGRRAR
ncbi:AbrB family transcriptional regulator [Roseivivax sp. GX 12232]|uniref:AbrB family transcriptional regulator n=1 Tax=Roseivivax sp. GX 12232 TaxID=2900547 RepID=UPI001E5AAEDC|nr:AbrB family transcriptional regulator [Roseivivax sp. GX 12232]